MGRNGHFRAEQFIKAIPGTGGIVSTIASKVGCNWHTAKKYIDTMPTVRQAYDNECEIVIDMAEGVLMKGIKSGDTADAKWYLTRKGKGRGYVERQEFDHGEININVRYKDAP
ncbi:unnamed protein product [marine sediment metagenome]|uniref:Uncharacterized protein n=1 Tax=marine sediment metagenome TaxID=412755 RepID=X1N6L8_9ZZZZ